MHYYVNEDILAPISLLGMSKEPSSSVHHLPDYHPITHNAKIGYTVTIRTVIPRSL